MNRIQTSPVSQIIAEAALIPSPALRTAVQRVIALAVENADDTVWAETEAPACDWNSVFFGTVCSVLDDGLESYADHVIVNVRGRDKHYPVGGALEAACSDWFLSRTEAAAIRELTGSVVGIAHVQRDI